jgi:hypothetical protein
VVGAAGESFAAPARFDAVALVAPLVQRCDGVGRKPGVREASAMRELRQLQDELDRLRGRLAGVLSLRQRAELRGTLDEAQRMLTALKVVL